MEKFDVIEAEKALLACLITNNSIIEEVLGKVKVTDFQRASHRVIYSAIIQIYEKGEPVDYITLKDTLGNRLEDVGGLMYIVSLQCPTSYNYSAYLRIVKDNSRKIELEKLLNMGKGNIDKKEPNELIAFIRDNLESMESNIVDNEPVVAKDLIDKLSGEWKEQEEPIGLKTGYWALDNILNGFHKGDLIILAARPAMGKTAFALNIASNVATRKTLDHKPSVLVFSLEMTKEQLMIRLISAYSGISSGRFLAGYNALKDVWYRIDNARNFYKEANLFIEDNGDVDLEAVGRIAKRIKAKHGLDLVVIDYLQLLVSSKNKNYNREQEVAIVSKGLKALAKKLECPVLCLAQLSRAVEQRTGEKKKPMLSDLRESGSIEQDADIVMFIYRDEYYNPASNDVGTAEIIVAKHRKGGTGSAVLKFDKTITRFENK